MRIVSADNELVGGLTARQATDGRDGKSNQQGLGSATFRARSSKIVTSTHSTSTKRQSLPLFNFSFHNTRRADVQVGTDYGADLDATRKVLEQAAEAVHGRLADKPAVVVLLNLGGSSIDWEVRVWCKRVEFLDVSQRIRRDLKVALDAAGIGIPFPQMDVHLDGGPIA